MLIPVDSKLAIHELLARAAFGYDERDKPLLLIASQMMRRLRCALPAAT